MRTQTSLFKQQSYLFHILAIRHYGKPVSENSFFFYLFSNLPLNKSQQADESTPFFTASSDLSI